MSLALPLNVAFKNRGSLPFKRKLGVDRRRSGSTGWDVTESVSEGFPTYFSTYFYLSFTRIDIFSREATSLFDKGQLFKGKNLLDRSKF